MVFAFRSQPLKALYTVYFVLFTLFVRLPLWIALSIVPSMRVRPGWSFGQALLVRLLQAYTQLMYVDIGLPPPLDPEKQARSADKLRFGWVEPVTNDFVVAQVATAAKANNVRPARISGYWFGKRDANGRHGQRAAPGEHVLLSVHGGGYLTGSADPASPSTPMLAGVMAHSGGLIERAFAVEYRLSSAAPLPAANPFPAALLDVLSAYQYLVCDLGFEPKNILVEGDSAGAHAGFSLALYLIRAQFAGLPPPGGLLLICPGVDLTPEFANDRSSSMTRNRHSDFIHAILANGYAADALRGSLPTAELSSNAYLSPASRTLEYKRGFFGHMPATCIVAGDAEVLIDAIRTFRDRLVADNGVGAVTYHEYPDAVHNWLMFPFEPQRTAAYEDIQRWIISLWGK